MAYQGAWHSGSLYECYAVTGSPTFVTTSPSPRKSHNTYSLQLGSGDEASVCPSSNYTNLPTSMAKIFYMQYSSTPSGSATFLQVKDANGAVMCYLTMNNTNITIFDSTDTNKGTGAHGMSAGSWHRVAIVCGLADGTSGNVTVYVDGTTVVSTTSADTLVGSFYYREVNWLGNTQFGNLSISDHWSFTGYTADYDVVMFVWDSGSDSNGTPDAGSFGNAATIPWQTSVDFELTASSNTVNWLTDTTGTGGPAGSSYSFTDAASYLIETTYLVSRDGGGSTSHLIGNGFGSNATSDPGYSSVNIGGSTTFWEGGIGTSPQMRSLRYGRTWNTGDYCAMAVGVSGGQDIHCYGAIATVLLEVAASRIVTCTTEVVSAVANAATINKQRGVNAGTEVVQASANNATVLVGVTINGVTEAVSVTTSPAAVARDRLVAAVSEAVIAQTVNVIVNSTRNVDGVTETVLVAENPADVARDRTIIGLTEVVQAVANSASVVRPRAVAAVTEVIVLTEVDASVSRGISVSGTVEEIVVTETSASVGKSRNVLGASEVVAVPVNGAGINRSRIVVGTTEVLQAIEAAASVNTTRNVDGTTEVVTVAENNANVNLSRPVSGAVEVITVTENDATITYSGTPLIVSGLTEAVTVSSVAAAINATRNVQASPEAVNATTNAAVVNTSRGVAGFVEALNVAMNTADINKTRGVLGNTEVVVLEEYPATVELGPPPVVAQGRGISSDVGRHITIDITTDIT